MLLSRQLKEINFPTEAEIVFIDAELLDSLSKSFKVYNDVGEDSLLKKVKICCDGYTFKIKRN